jgi:hypothetical protein
VEKLVHLNGQTEMLPSRRKRRGHATIKRIPTLRREWEKVEVIPAKRQPVQ